MTDILEIAKLDACEVSGDGASIKLSVTDGQGRPLDLQVTAEQAGSLAMTLPRLVDAALKARYRDPSLRLVYPLTDYNLEGAVGSENLILSLKTHDGFEVSFSVEPEALKRLGQLARHDHKAAVEPRPLH